MEPALLLLDLRLPGSGERLCSPSSATRDPAVVGRCTDRLPRAEAGGYRRGSAGGAGGDQARLRPRSVQWVDEAIRGRPSAYECLTRLRPLVLQSPPSTRPTYPRSEAGPGPAGGRTRRWWAGRSAEAATAAGAKRRRRWHRCGRTCRRMLPSWPRRGGVRRLSAPTMSVDLEVGWLLSDWTALWSGCPGRSGEMTVDAEPVPRLGLAASLAGPAAAAPPPPRSLPGRAKAHRSP